MDQPKTDKRTAILRAALEVFAENGFHASPTSLLAQKAGVGTGTIYRYFESKDDLIRELHRELEEKMEAEVFSDYPDAVPLRQRFDILYERLLRYFLCNPLELRFMEQFFNSPYGVAKRRAKWETPSVHDTRFTSLFLEAREQGSFKDLPNEMLVSLSIGPMIAVLRDHLSGFLLLDDAMIPLVVASCWDAVAR